VHTRLRLNKSYPEEEKSVEIDQGILANVIGPFTWPLKNRDKSLMKKLST